MTRIAVVAATLTVAAAFGANAQSITGSVVDKKTGEPLIGVNIVVNGLEIGTVTDDGGHYALEVGRSGDYRISFRYLGYQTAIQDVQIADGDQTVDVALSPSAIEYAPITVTAKAEASDILSTPQPTVVVDKAHIERDRGAAAFDALANTEGVRLLRTGAGIAKPMIRGLTSQRVVVVQDGIRQEGQQWGDEHGPELDAYGIDRIEIVKGPASLLYGSDALGGVVHALSDDLFELTEPVSGSVLFQGIGSNRLGAGSARVGGASNGYVYEGLATYKRAGSFSTPDGVVPNSGFDEYDVAVRGGRSYREGHYLVSYNRTSLKLGLFEPNAGSDAEPVSNSRYDINLPFQRVQHDKVGLHVKQQVGRSHIEWTSAWQRNRRREFEESASIPGSHWRLTTVNSDLRFHHAPIGRMVGTVGLSGSVQQNKTLGEEHLIPTGTTWNGAAYVTEDLMLATTTLSGGIRYDHRDLSAEADEELGNPSTSRGYDELSGALGLAWHPGDGLSVGLNAGRAWRGPVLIELFGNGVHEGTIRFEKGDPNLVAEKSLSLDATVRWMSQHHYLEVSLFRNGIDDYIFIRRTGLTDPETGFEVYQYSQAQATISGGEFRLDVHPHPLDWLHLGASGDLTRGRNNETDTNLPFMPADRVRFEVGLTRAALAGGLTDARIDFGTTLVAAQNRVDANELPTEGHQAFDMSASARYDLGTIVLHPLLAVDNVFDARYLDHLSRYRIYDVAAPGRSVRFSVSMEF